MFDIGTTVIDAKKKVAPTICAVIENSCPTIYVAEDEGNLYLVSEENLIKYNKYWFDSNK